MSLSSFLAVFPRYPTNHPALATQRHFLAETIKRQLRNGGEGRAGRDEDVTRGPFNESYAFYLFAAYPAGPGEGGKWWFGGAVGSTGGDGFFNLLAIRHDLWSRRISWAPSPAWGRTG